MDAVKVCGQEESTLVGAAQGARWAGGLFAIAIAIVVTWNPLSEMSDKSRVSSIENRNPSSLPTRKVYVPVSGAW